MNYIKNPMAIEVESFKIIDRIVTDEFGGYPTTHELQNKILQRVIHTSADFDYLKNLYFSHDILERLVDGFGAPLTIYTDTNMALSGINKTALKSAGAVVKCYVSDEETALYAKENQMTRSMAAVIRASKEPGMKLFVYGNAPTALFQTLELYETLKEETIGIVGVPVGFVGAVESKDALKDSGVPCIAALGRKGGSNVAAAIVNAVLYYVVGRDNG